ncbi:MAG: YaiO family outer membrane beta-barrel protein [Nevskiales bacterium]
MCSSRPRRKLATCSAGFAAILSAFTVPAIAAATDNLANPAQRESLPATPERWIFTSLFSHSGLSGGRDDWNVADFELLYRSSPKLILGGQLSVRDREQGTDALYGALFSYQASPTLEWHGMLTFAPDPEFSARQKYSAGIEWRSEPRVSLLFDVEQLNFAEGPVDQYKPGLIYWFSDRTWLTGRYTLGHAFHAERYDAVSLQLNLGLSEGRRLTLGIAHGTDPEKDPAVPGVILTTADTYSIYYRTPLRPSLELIVGAEYEDRRDIYSRTTATLGLVKRF